MMNNKIHDKLIRIAALLCDITGVTMVVCSVVTLFICLTRGYSHAWQSALAMAAAAAGYAAAFSIFNAKKDLKTNKAQLASDENKWHTIKIALLVFVSVIMIVAQIHADRTWTK